MPPRIVRRLVIGPLVVIGAVLAVALSPLLIAVAAVVDLSQRRRWRAVRLVALGVVFAAFEAFGLLALFGLWVIGGFGLAFRTVRFRRLHVFFLRFWLKGISTSILKLLGLRIDYERGERAPRPVLVFSRHAGPGDSVFLTRTVTTDFDRQPRVVGRKELQWAPFFDSMGHRLPHHFVDSRPKDRQKEFDAIEALAAGMDENGALVLFPEGGNFTVTRRERAISRLERRGRFERASRAVDMPNLVAPRPGGAMAAMRGAPEADVIFVAHSGLEDLTSLAALWDLMPLDRTIKARYWRITADERPAEGDEHVDWLFRWWAEIDQWIEANRPADVGA